SFRSSSSLFFACSSSVRDLRSFPTRRSSDLDQRCSDPHPARVELRRVIERDGVAVERDADRVRDVLHLLARALLLSQVDEHQMVDRKSTRLNSSHGSISYAVFCLKKNSDAYE